jgi:hypothetical protein
MSLEFDFIRIFTVTFSIKNIEIYNGMLRVSWDVRLF